jgi:hypothetical protein
MSHGGYILSEADKYLSTMTNIYPGCIILNENF